MGRVAAVCISENKGTKKSPVFTAELIKDYGIKGDAHAGRWHRQVSMLSLESIEKFRDKCADVSFGAFGENLVMEGFDFINMKVGTRIRIGDAVLEMTQIGKSCHGDCSIKRETGECIMPEEGAFFKVLSSGRVTEGDEAVILGPDLSAPFTAAAITLSDRAFSGEREDESGEVLKKILEDEGYEVIEKIVLSDDKEPLKRELCRLADQRQVNVIFTTGGTGFSPRDNTPEATGEVCDRMAPGIAEAIRYYSLEITPRAMLSRGVSGIRHNTLIVNLPGSPGAVAESLSFILPSLKHGLGILTGREGECAGKEQR